MGLPDPVVCIVGAGPAGLVTAHLLHQAGVPFVLLERQQADQLRARVKAGMIEHRTVELLQRHGLAGPILRGGLRVGQCEWRADGQAFLLDYAKLCGGRGHYIYPQHDLVADWAGDLLARGGDVRFGFTVTGIEQAGGGALVRATAGPDGAPVAIECLAVVVCDGAGSAVGTGAAAFGAAYPTRWLTLIAAVPPPPDGTIYGLHEQGFAGQMHRSATLSRFILEVPGGAGGKGMNIAIQDAAELAGGLIERYGGRGDGGRLDRYSQTRLPHIWRHQEFSNLMLSLFNAGPAGGSGFSYGLRRARLGLVLSDPQFSRWFAHTYVGVDE